jgi:hypothetical protein
MIFQAKIDWENIGCLERFLKRVGLLFLGIL